MNEQGRGLRRIKGRETKRENEAFWLITFEKRTESPGPSYREKLNIFINLFSPSSPAAAAARLKSRSA